MYICGQTTSANFIHLAILLGTTAAVNDNDDGEDDNLDNDGDDVSDDEELEEEV